MKLKDKDRKVIASGGLAEDQFGISVSDQAHIITILRDKLYSNKPLAVVREYTTNAIDEHVETGQDEVPIKVHLPTHQDNTFKVRDFGNGLSEDQVFKLYIKYGASTKRTSNAVIGQLGIGCKAAFAYTNSFNIISYHQGKKSIYTAYIDESGLGKMQKMTESDTTEPSGIEIQVKVNPGDINAFTNEARNLFQYFTVRPITNVKFQYINSVVLQGSCWYILNSKLYGQPGQSYISLNNPKVIMGNIAYTINKNLVLNSAKESGKYNSETTQLFNRILSTPIVIQCDIGDLSISASRENLEYKNGTTENLIKYLEVISDEIEEKFKDKFKDCKSPWEAYRKRLELIASIGHTAASLIPKTWNNENIRHFRKTLDVPFGIHQIAQLNRHHSQRRFLSLKKSSWPVELGSIAAIYIDDVKTAPVKRAKALQNEHSDLVVHIISVEDNMDKSKLVEKFIKKNGLEGIPVRKLSDANYKKATVVGYSKGITEKIAKQSDVFFEFNKDQEAHNGWKPIKTPVEELNNVVYIPIYRYKPDLDSKNVVLSSGTNGRQQSYELVYRIQTCDDINNKEKKSTIIGVRSNSIHSIPKSWIRVDDYVEYTIKNFRKKYKSRIAYDHAMDTVKGLWRLTYDFNAVLNYYNNHKNKKSTKFTKLLYNLKKYYCSKYREEFSKRLHKYYAISYAYKDHENDKESEKYNKEFQHINKNIVQLQISRYPLLRYIVPSGDSIESIIEYGNLMDEARKNARTKNSSN